MPSYDLNGTVKEVFDPQTFASGFTKRDFIVTTDEDYPQDIKFECIKENCALLERIQAGERVQVRFRLRGNSYNGRYFVNLQAQTVETVGADPPGATSPEDDPALVPADDDLDPVIDF